MYPPFTILQACSSGSMRQVLLLRKRVEVDRNFTCLNKSICYSQIVGLLLRLSKLRFVPISVALLHDVWIKIIYGLACGCF